MEMNERDANKKWKTLELPLDVSQETQKFPFSFARLSVCPLGRSVVEQNEEKRREASESVVRIYSAFAPSAFLICCPTRSLNSYSHSDSHSNSL